MSKPVTESELIERSQFPRVTFEELQANIVGNRQITREDRKSVV